MENNSNSKFKYFVVASLIIVLVIISAFLFGSHYLDLGAKPTQVLDSTFYPEGTTIELWAQIPPDFPKELILENNQITHADVVNLAGNKKQITVTYTSKTDVSALAQRYLASIENSDWMLGVNNINPAVSTILAKRESETLIITLIPKVGGETEVTFQYEK